MRAFVKARWVAGALLLGFVALNAVTCRQARLFTRFSPGPRARPQLRTLGQKLDVLVHGVRVPRPENRRTPASLDLPYERHVFAGGRGVALEAWMVSRAGARGTVVLFHGHGVSKESLLDEASAFHELGWNAFLIDFRGSGGSGGNETSIGFYEALDVTRSLGYVQGLPASGPIVLYGESMGAAAVLKGVADDGLAPAALILECPFHSLLGTVRHRFTAHGLPSFPLADLFVLWSGVHAGFNGFRFRPVESAAHIDRPTLLMNGDRDPWVRPDEARAIFGALRGPKTLRFFAGVEHASCLQARPEEWTRTVARFLDALPTASAAATPPRPYLLER